MFLSRDQLSWQQYDQLKVPEEVKLAASASRAFSPQAWLTWISLLHLRSVVEQEWQEGAKAKVLDQATGVKGQDQEIEVVLEMAMGLDEVDVEGLGGTEEAMATEVKMVEVMD